MLLLLPGGRHPPHLYFYTDIIQCFSKIHNPAVQKSIKKDSRFITPAAFLLGKKREEKREYMDSTDNSAS